MYFGKVHVLVSIEHKPVRYCTLLSRGVVVGIEFGFSSCLFSFLPEFLVHYCGSPCTWFCSGNITVFINCNFYYHNTFIFAGVIRFWKRRSCSSWKTKWRAGSLVSVSTASWSVVIRIGIAGWYTLISTGESLPLAFSIACSFSTGSIAIAGKCALRARIYLVNFSLLFFFCLAIGLCFCFSVGLCLSYFLFDILDL